MNNLVISSLVAWTACQGLAACLLDVPKDFDSTYVSPKLVLDKPSGTTAYYRLTFDAKSPVDGYWWVDFYDREDTLLPDVNSRLYASGGFIPYDVVVPACPEAVTAVVKFSLKKPNVAQVRDLKMRRISVDEAAAWCARTYAAGPQLVPFETAGSWERLPKTRKVLFGGKRRFDVVLLGDSLMNDSYCGLLGVQMQKAFPDVDLRVHISVRGSTGCWYYHEKEHFEECVAKYRPDLVLIGGISNCQTNRFERYRANRALVEEDFVETIERCKAIGAEVIVCTPPKSVEFRTSPDAKELPADFNDESTAADYLQLAFERRAAERTGVQLWDLNGPTCRTVALSGKPLGWFNRDAVHNDDRGKQLIAQAFGAYFREALKTVLRPTAFRSLAPGQVRAERWLLRQLELQRDGLTGHAEEIFDDIGNSDWLTGGNRGGQYAWERGPYYLKGLVSLAYVMDDAALKAKARRWIESILKSQRENGDFGPRDCNWWANMIVLHLMRDYFEATGDARALAFLERYFEFQREALRKKPLGAESIWADQRGGDELEVVLWLCGREGGAKWLDFARLVADQTRRARDNGRATNGTGHIVNFMQGLKAAALKWRLGGEGSAADAYWRVFGPEGREFLAYGRPDRMLNGSETFSDNRASEGTELCAIVERILSNRTILEVSGDVRVADDLESVAYNALPATLPPDLRGTRYYNVLNQPVCDDRLPKKMQANGAGAAVCPGPEAGFGCCRSNWHFGWPKFVSSLWMAADEGLAAVAYGPCRVKAKAADGEVEIREETDYPFRETVALTVMSATATRPFELKFRIPGWCTDAQLTVNGEAVRPCGAGSFTAVRRPWKVGDRIELKLPMRTIVSDGWVKNSSAVLRGPLVYARPIAFRREQIGGVPDKGFPKWRLVPTEAWNDGLVLFDAPMKVVELPVAEQPFDPATPPVVIEAEATPCTVHGWGTMVSDPGDTGRAVEPPWTPWTVSPKFETKTLRLQPVGATELRITLFPCAWCRK